MGKEFEPSEVRRARREKLKAAAIRFGDAALRADAWADRPQTVPTAKAAVTLARVYRDMAEAELDRLLADADMDDVEAVARELL